jgi:hypothetical protein
VGEQLPAIPADIRKTLEAEGEVQIGERVSILLDGDDIVMRGSPTGQHVIDFSGSDEARLQALVKGYQPVDEVGPD